MARQELAYSLLGLLDAPLPAWTSSNSAAAMQAAHRSDSLSPATARVLTSPDWDGAAAGAGPLGPLILLLLKLRCAVAGARSLVQQCSSPHHGRQSTWLQPYLMLEGTSYRTIRDANN